MNAGPEGPDRRAALTREIADRTGLDEIVIEGFVRAFYAAARADPLLGPKFDGVADWEAHIARIARFWNAVALMTGGYHGQPMQAHAHLGLTSAHFARWLALFEDVARSHFECAGADHMLDRARRIARSLEMGLVPLDLPAIERARRAPPDRIDRVMPSPAPAGRAERGGDRERP